MQICLFLICIIFGVVIIIIWNYKHKKQIIKFSAGQEIKDEDSIIDNKNIVVNEVSGESKVDKKSDIGDTYVEEANKQLSDSINIASKYKRPKP